MLMRYLHPVVNKSLKKNKSGVLAALRLLDKIADRTCRQSQWLTSIAVVTADQ